MVEGVTGCQGGEIYRAEAGLVGPIAVSFMHFSYEGLARTWPADPQNRLPNNLKGSSYSNYQRGRRSKVSRVARNRPVLCV